MMRNSSDPTTTTTSNLSSSSSSSSTMPSSSMSSSHNHHKIRRIKTLPYVVLFLVLIAVSIQCLFLKHEIKSTYDWAMKEVSSYYFPEQLYLEFETNPAYDLMINQEEASSCTSSDGESRICGASSSSSSTAESSSSTLKEDKTSFEKEEKKEASAAGSSPVSSSTTSSTSTDSTSSSASTDSTSSSSNSNDNNNDKSTHHEEQEGGFSSSLTGGRILPTRKTKSGLNLVVLSYTIQGFNLPKDMLEWKKLLLPSASKGKADSDDELVVTKTVCTTSDARNVFPVFPIQHMFEKYPGWEFVHEGNSFTSPNACQNSFVRILDDIDYKDGRRFDSMAIQSLHENKLSRLNQHIEGKQLTTSILGGSIFDKATLSSLIQESSDSNLLKDALPQTRMFDSTQDCFQFCSNEWYNNNYNTEWIWKPKNDMGGNGIMLIGDHSEARYQEDNEESLARCRGYCVNIGGEYAQAQELLTSRLLKMKDGRKFDVRSHIVVANVHPLIVFTGAEYIRVCAESLDEVNPEPYPEIPPGAKWNPYQQVCNLAISKQHPTKFVPKQNIGPLQMGIPNPVMRAGILKKIDDLDRALINLLKENFDGKVGMFQVFAADYLIDKQGKPYLLELNSSPAWEHTGKLFDNPWGDIFQIEWTILDTYNNQYYFNNQNNAEAVDEEEDGIENNNDDENDGDGNKKNGTWEEILNQKLSELDLETLRMLKF